MNRLVHNLAAFALLVSCTAPGNFEVPMCESNSDCDSGETCDEGLCFGNPPFLTLAAELVPPEGREDLARTSIASLEIVQDGTIVNARFSASVLVKGRVFLSTDPSISVSALIKFTRPSIIAGAPAFTTTVPSSPGKTPGQYSFQAWLPATNADNPADQYSVLVQPDDTPGMNGVSPAELAPPTRHRLALSADMVQDFALGDPEGLKRIEGMLLTSNGDPIVNRTIRAWGRFAPGLELEIASSLGRTNANGYFVLLAPVSWLDTFDIVVSAATGDAPSPSIRRRDVFVPDPSGMFQVPTILDDLIMPSFGTPRDYVLPVVGQSTGGGTAPADSANVTVFTVLATAPDEVSFMAFATTDSSGDAQLKLIPGRDYTLTIEPAGSSPLGGVWNDTLSAPEQGDLTEHVLPARIPVTGRLFYETLERPARNVSVLAQPTLTYQYSGLMTDESRADLRTIRLPETTTTSEGGFRIDLDRALLQMVTSYDLLWQPASGSLLPRWLHKDIDLGDLGGAAMTLDLGDLFLPHAAYSRGEILDPLGVPVAGAQIRVYIVPDADAACAQATQSDCTPKVFDAALATSDSDGRVIVVLPTPPVL